MKWSRIGYAPPRSIGPPPSGRPYDPYLVWADVTSFRGFANLAEFKLKRQLPVLLEVEDRAVLDDLLHDGSVARAKAYDGRRFCTLLVALDRGPSVFTKLRRAGPFELGVPAVPSGGVVGNDPQNFVRPDASAVIGVIDDGCAPLHRQWFFDLEGLRIAALWDQGRAAGAAGWWEPTAMLYGRQLVNFDPPLPSTPGRIDRIRRDLSSLTSDESLWYRLLGYPRSLTRGIPERLHGTHVTDIAAGWPDPLGGRLDAAEGSVDDQIADTAIVAVGLPRLNTEDTSGGSLGFHVLDGLHYIVRVRSQLRRRDGLPAAPPLVVNLSYGTLAGPHDGSSLIERAIDDLMRKTEDMAVVIGAGNGRESRCHARIVLQPGEQRQLVWLRRADDPTDSFAELWWRPVYGGGATAPRLDVRLALPDAGSSPWVRPDDARQWSNGARTLAAVLHYRDPPNGNGPMALVCGAPTAPRDGMPAAPSGLWTLHLRNRSKVAIEVDGWVERDDAPSRSRLPRGQSRWLDVPPGTVTEACTLNSLATGIYPIVVGAYYWRTRQPTPYSALGPDRRPAGDPDRREGPDLLAPGDEHPSLPGLSAAAVRSGNQTRMSGTSVSAPIVTRRAAAWLAQQAPGLDAAQVRQKLLEVLCPPQTPVPPPHHRGGKPRLIVRP